MAPLQAWERALLGSECPPCQCLHKSLCSFRGRHLPIGQRCGRCNNRNQQIPDQKEESKNEMKQDVEGLFFQRPLNGISDPISSPQGKAKDEIASLHPSSLVSTDKLKRSSTLSMCCLDSLEIKCGDGAVGCNGTYTSSPSTSAYQKQFWSAGMRITSTQTTFPNPSNLTFGLHSGRP